MIKTPKPVLIAILTVVTVFFWIVFGIIRIIAQPEKVDVDPKVLEPLTPTFDAEILSKLETRIFLSESEIPETIIITPEETPTPTPVATESAEVSPTPESTASPEALESPTPSP
ncbi:hypothetical protein HYT59_02660 [Candidatus Woesebacteria bacterium]|nr:hypothetical protein [Candidatus Woesebacteria bacterium]